MGRLKKYFWESLPHYFFGNDTYKDQDPDGLGRGLLERYLLTFQEEAEVTDSWIAKMSLQLFPSTIQEDLLSLLAGLYGNPPDTFGNVQWYRNLLANIIEINKVKGTVLGFEKFFAIMETDLEISITESSYFNYDQASIAYDQPGVHYDGYCHPCVTVDINILPGSPIPGIEGPYNQNMKENIWAILNYLLPINGVIGSFSYNGDRKPIDKSPLLAISPTGVLDITPTDASLKISDHE